MASMKHVDSESPSGVAALAADRIDESLASTSGFTARTLALDTAIGLLTLAGASTCAAALFLFLGTLRDASSVATQTVLFGFALLSTVAALAAFLIDSILAWHGLFREGPTPKVRPPAD
jgi:Protein of unknown function (DUF2721)